MIVAKKLLLLFVSKLDMGIPYMTYIKFSDFLVGEIQSRNPHDLKFCESVKI